jgi:hypothetical protein
MTFGRPCPRSASGRAPMSVGAHRAGPFGTAACAEKRSLATAQIQLLRNLMQHLMLHSIR